MVVSVVILQKHSQHRVERTANSLAQINVSGGGCSGLLRRRSRKPLARYGQKEVVVKYIVLLMALVSVPFFPNSFSVFGCGFNIGFFVAMLIQEELLKNYVEKPQRR
jgi:hypothetical protein